MLKREYSISTEFYDTSYLTLICSISNINCPIASAIKIYYKQTKPPLTPKYQILVDNGTNTDIT